MSHNTFGHLFRVTTWGESHGPAIGCVVDGCPPRLPLEAAAAFEARAGRRSEGFDVLGDYGAFRDLQRHRLLTLARHLDLVAGGDPSAEAGQRRLRCGGDFPHQSGRS